MIPCEGKIDPNSLRRALTNEALRLLQAYPLTPITDVGRHLSSSGGIYALYHHERMVYVGKAVNVRSRLSRHQKKLTNTSLTNIGFRYVVWNSYDMLAVEEELIDRLRPFWNTLGFGSNEPGAGRNAQRTSRWDQRYQESPMDLHA